MARRLLACQLLLALCLAASAATTKAPMTDEQLKERGECIKGWSADAKYGAGRPDASSPRLPEAASSRAPAREHCDLLTTPSLLHAPAAAEALIALKQAIAPGGFGLSKIKSWKIAGELDLGAERVGDRP